MNTIVQKGLKPRTIKQVIRKKLDEWLKTLPVELKEKVESHIIVTGGCIASMLLGEQIKDFDLYCDNQKTAELLARYYVQVFNRLRKTDKSNTTTAEPYVNVTTAGRISIYVKSSGAAGVHENGSDYTYFEQEPEELAEAYIDKLVNAEEDPEKFKGKYRPVFLSENAISLSDKTQIVIRFYGPPDEIHKNYDYVHATNYYHTADEQLVLRNEALTSLLSRALIYQGSLYPVCSLFRMRKFMDRGWRISAGEITKMAMQISELDLGNVAVLREQLIGVDMAYFFELLRLIDNWKENNPDKPVDAAYVIKLIDQLVDKF